MPLFERGNYSRRANEEFEKTTRELEEKQKLAEKERAVREFNETSAQMNNNLSFAVRIGLISEAMANEYRERIKQAAINLQTAKEVEEQANIVAKQAKITEQSAKGVSMEETQAVIARLRAERQAQQEKSEQEHSSQSQSKISDEVERGK